MAIKTLIEAPKRSRLFVSHRPHFHVANLEDCRNRQFRPSLRQALDPSTNFPLAYLSREHHASSVPIATALAPWVHTRLPRAGTLTITDGV
jgi:hypothetical protein